MAKKVNDCQIVLGRNVRRIRLFLKITQANLAEKLGVSVNFVSEIESGKAWVSGETMDKIAHFLGCEFQDLFKSESEGLPEQHEETDEILNAMELEMSKRMKQLRKAIIRKKK